MSIFSFWLYSWGFLFSPLNIIGLVHVSAVFGGYTIIFIAIISIVFFMVCLIFINLQKITGPGARLLFFFEFYLGERSVLFIHVLLCLVFCTPITLLSVSLDPTHFLLNGLTPLISLYLYRKRYSLNYLSSLLIIGTTIYFVIECINSGTALSLTTVESMSIPKAFTSVFFVYGAFEALFSMSYKLRKELFKIVCWTHLILLFFVTSLLLFIICTYGVPTNFFNSIVFEIACVVYIITCQQEVFHKWNELTSDLNLFNTRTSRSIIWPLGILWIFSIIGYFIGKEACYSFAETSVAFIYYFSFLSYDLLCNLFARKQLFHLKIISTLLQIFCLNLTVPTDNPYYSMGSISFSCFSWVALVFTTRRREASIVPLLVIFTMVFCINISLLLVPDYLGLLTTVGTTITGISVNTLCKYYVNMKKHEILEQVL